MRHFRDLPFAKKQRFIILLTSAVVLLLASGAFLVNNLFRLHHSLVTELYTLADSIAFSSDVSLVFGDVQTTAQSLSILKGNSRIMVAHVFDTEGAMFAVYERANNSNDAAAPDDNTNKDVPPPPQSDDTALPTSGNTSSGDYPFNEPVNEPAESSVTSSPPGEAKTDYPFAETGTDSDYPYKSQEDVPPATTDNEAAADSPFNTTDDGNSQAAETNGYPYPDSAPASMSNTTPAGNEQNVTLGGSKSEHTLFNYHPHYNGKQPDNFAIEDLNKQYFYHKKYIEVFTPVVYRGEVVGVVHIRSDLTAFYDAVQETGIITIGVFLLALLLATLIATFLQRIVTKPLLDLVSTMNVVYTTQDYSVRQTKHSNDEIGSLVDGFNAMLAKIEARDRELAKANDEISGLNERLKEENLRMGAELEVTRQLQQMVLPRPEELQEILELDIAGFMEPADEVGGDYYDVLPARVGNGLKIAIGDVTGHGLESGVVMLMVQTAVCTLLEHGVTDPNTFMTVLNRAIYRNIRRMRTDKNLTLSLLDYEDGNLRVVGQHEDVLVIRKGGIVERMNTVNLGFMVGMMQDISSFVGSQEIYMEIGDSVVLYTDGVTEAMNTEYELYGVERLCEVAGQHWEKTAGEIEKAIIADVRRHMGEQQANDDITLVVIKRREDGHEVPPGFITNVEGQARAA